MIQIQVNAFHLDYAKAMSQIVSFANVKKGKNLIIDVIVTLKHPNPAVPMFGRGGRRLRRVQMLPD